MSRHAQIFRDVGSNFNGKVRLKIISDLSKLTLWPEACWYIYRILLMAIVYVGLALQNRMMSSAYKR